MTRARSLSQLANSSVFTVATNNRVGIGSEVPTAKLDVDGTLNVSGNATIGGVATYEDVTNVDSVGIVTARSGVSVPDGQKIQLGNSNDLQIYHTGSHSLIDEAGTGNLTIRSSLISFEKYTNEQLARFTADGSCELFHNNSKKLETTSTGLSVTGAALVDSPSASTGGVEISRYGVYIRSDDSYSKAFAIHNGGYTASDETILFNSDGSAAFSSSITAQNTILANRTGSTQTAFQATLSGVTKVDIKAGGAATFAGAITSSNNISANAFISPNNGNTTRFLISNASGNTVTMTNDGAAHFATQLITGSANSVTSTSSHGSYIGEGIVVNAIQPNATSAAQERVWLGKLANVTKSEIFKDGSATFAAGKATIDASNGYKFTSSSGAFGQINGDGIYQMQTDGSTVGAQILANGSATFNGPIKTRQDSNSALAFAVCQGGTANSDATIRFNGNGSATFDGGVVSKQEVYVQGTTTSTQRYLNFQDSGTSNYRATLRRDAWYLGDPVTNIGNVTPSGAKIVLNMSGSASFAGAVDVGTFSSGTSGIRLTNTGTIYIGGTGNNAGLNIGNSAAVIDYDGSAAFAARFSPGTTSLNDHAIVATNNNATNGVIVAQNMNNSGALFQGYNGSSVKTVDIFSDGNAIFRGKLDVGQSYAAAEIARFGKTASGATSYLAFHTANANYGFIGSANQLIPSTSASDFALRAQGNMLFASGGSTLRAIIDTTGNLLVGKSGSNFAVAGVEVRPGGEITLTRAGDLLTTRRITSEGVHISIRNISGSVIGSVSTNGTNASFNTSSDYRLKENVVDITDGITRVKQLHPKRFNFIVDSDTTVDGFLAHEAQTVVPEAVTGTHNEVEVWQETDELPEGVSVGDNKLDDEGNTVPVMQGIDQSKLVPLLTAALQEAIAEIESLKARVTTLEG